VLACNSFLNNTFEQTYTAKATQVGFNFEQHNFVLLELQFCFEKIRNLLSAFYQHFVISVTLVLLPLFFLATTFDVRHFTFILNIGILLPVGG